MLTVSVRSKESCGFSGYKIETITRVRDIWQQMSQELSKMQIRTLVLPARREYRDEDFRKQVQLQTEVLSFLKRNHSDPVCVVPFECVTCLKETVALIRILGIQKIALTRQQYYIRCHCSSEIRESGCSADHRQYSLDIMEITKASQIPSFILDCQTIRLLSSLELDGLNLKLMNPSMETASNFNMRLVQSRRTGALEMVSENVENMEKLQSEATKYNRLSIRKIGSTLLLQSALSEVDRKLDAHENQLVLRILDEYTL
ncbi:unnamed protein product, partial [Mesorhabditis spiculigera]